MINITRHTRAGELIEALNRHGKMLRAVPTHGNANIQKRPRYAGQFGKARKGVPA